MTKKKMYLLAAGGVAALFLYAKRFVGTAGAGVQPSAGPSPGPTAGPPTAGPAPSVVGNASPLCSASWKDSCVQIPSSYWAGSGQPVPAGGYQVGQDVALTALYDNQSLTVTIAQRMTLLTPSFVGTVVSSDSDAAQPGDVVVFTGDQVQAGPM